jgi:hypothetical protein
LDGRLPAGPRAAAGRSAMGAGTRSSPATATVTVVLTGTGNNLRPPSLRPSQEEPAHWQDSDPESEGQRDSLLLNLRHLKLRVPTGGPRAGGVLNFGTLPRARGSASGRRPGSALRDSRGRSPALPAFLGPSLAACQCHWARRGHCQSPNGPVRAHHDRAGPSRTPPARARRPPGLGASRSPRGARDVLPQLAESCEQCHTKQHDHARSLRLGPGRPSDPESESPKLRSLALKVTRSLSEGVCRAPTQGRLGARRS